MKVKQLRFDRWSTLHGTANLDADRISVLLVDTENEVALLESALAALLSGAVTDPRGDGGLLESLLEVSSEPGAAPCVWRVEGRAAALPATTGGLAQRFPGVADRRFRARGDTAPPWIVPASDLARGTDLAAVSRWLRARVDTGGASRTAEDVAAALHRLAGPEARAQLAALDAQLDALDRRLAELDSDRATAAAWIERAGKLRAAHDLLAPAGAALADPDFRARLAALEHDLFAHRAAHTHDRALRRELSALHGHLPCDVETIEALTHDVDLWQRGQETLRSHEESLADASLAHARCTGTLERRAWAAGLPVRASEDIGRLAGRLEDVHVRERDLEATIALHESLPADAGAAARRIAHLEARVGGVTESERELAFASLDSTARGRDTTQRMSSELAGTRERVSRVAVLQSQLRMLVSSLGLGGAILAIAIQLSGWQHVNGISTATIALAGTLLFVLAAGIFATAGTLVSSRLGVLETQAAQLRVPLELEELRLSVAEFKIAEVCRRHAYADPAALAADLTEYDQLTTRPDTRAYVQARSDLARLRTEDLAPLETESLQLIAARSLPTAPNIAPATTLRRAWAQLQVHSIGRLWADRLTRTAADLAATAASIRVAQERRLANLDARLIAAGIAADPTHDLDAVRRALADQLAAASRAERIEAHDLPETRARQLSPNALRAKLRERRALRRQIQVPFDPVLAELEAMEGVRSGAAYASPVTDADAALAAAAAEIAADPAGGALRDELVLTQRQLDLLQREERVASAEAQQRLQAVYREGPAARQHRATLETKRAQLVARTSAAETAAAALHPAVVLGRGPAARLLNIAGMPRWTDDRSASRTARLADDLSIRLPAAQALEAASPVRALIAMRAGIAAAAGVYNTAALASAMAAPATADARVAVGAVSAAGGGGPSVATPRAAAPALAAARSGVPLVLIEPFEGFESSERATLMEWLAANVCPHPQVIVVSRRQSRWEQLRWEAPRIFPRLQLVQL